MDTLLDESMSDIKGEEAVTEIFENRNNIKAKTGGATDEQFSDVKGDKNVMDQWTDGDSRLPDFDQEEYSGDRKRRYDREFLLQYQYDRLVSIEPILLPVIPDIERQSKYRTEQYRSRKNNYYERSNNSQRMYRDDNERDSSDDSGKWPLGETFTVDESIDVSSRETLKYDDTCYIVVDCDGGEDEAETDNCENIETVDVNTHNSSTATDEPSVKDKLSTRTDQSKDSPRRRINEENKWTRSHRGERKRHFEHVERSDDIDYKRRRISSRWDSSENEFRKSFHVTNRGNDTYLGSRHQKYCSQTQFRQKGSKDWYYKRTELSHVKYSKNEAERNSNHGIDRSGSTSHRIRPVLYENGVPVQDRNEAVTTQEQEQLNSPLSPVSDRSISPYADFSGSYHYKEKLNPENFNRELKSPGGIVRNDVYVEDKVIKNRGTFPIGGYQPDLSASVPCIENNVYWSGFQGVPRAFPFGMDFRNQPNFQGHATYQGGQMLNIPFPNGQGFPVGLPNGVPSYQNQKTLQERGRACQNNIIVKDSNPIKSEEIECFWVSSKTWNSLSTDIQNNICFATYRAIIEADKEHLSPEDVIKMMKQNRPIVIEFETKDTLIDLLKRNWDKFTLQMDDQQISPKTDIKLCQTFTYKPNFKHDCTDLHICKYFLLDNCRLQHCKFSHRLMSKHNAKVLEGKDLGGLNEKNVKDLLRNLNNRNVSTTPLICKFYNNEGGCQRDEYCMHLHLCKHFINNNCMFRICKRSHDFNDKQPRAVLEKHGIFPNETNHNKILFLLRATLEDGEVRLKRELSNLPKHNSDALQNGPFTSSSPGLYVTHTIAKDIQEHESLDSDATKSMISAENNINNEKESTEQDSSPGSDKKLEQQICRTTNVKATKQELKRLPEYIPLEIINDTIEEHVRSVTKTDDDNDLKSLSEVDLVNTNAEIQLQQCDNVQEHDSMIPKEQSQDKTKRHVVLSETARLPRWRPLSIEMKDDTKTQINDKSETQITDTAKIQITDTAVRQISGNAELEITDKTETEITGKTETEITDKAVKEITNKVETEITGKAELQITGKAETEITDKAEIQITDIAEIQINDKVETKITDEAETQISGKTENQISDKAECQSLNRNIQESPSNKKDFNKNENHCIDNKYLDEEYENTTIKSNTEDDNEIENKENDTALKFDKEEDDHWRDSNKASVGILGNVVGYDYGVEAENKSSGLKTETRLEITNEYGRYRVRKNGENWQLQAITTSQTDTERTDVLKEERWMNIATAESDTLDDIYQTFNDFVGRNITVISTVEKSDE